MPELSPGDPENNENKITSVLGSISQRKKKRVNHASVVLCYEGDGAQKERWWEVLELKKT